MLAFPSVFFPPGDSKQELVAQSCEYNLCQLCIGRTASAGLHALLSRGIWCAALLQSLHAHHKK